MFYLISVALRVYCRELGGLVWISLRTHGSPPVRSTAYKTVKDIENADFALFSYQLVSFLPFPSQCSKATLCFSLLESSGRLLTIDFFIQSVPFQNATIPPLPSSATPLREPSLPLMEALDKPLRPATANGALRRPRRHDDDTRYSVLHPGHDSSPWTTINGHPRRSATQKKLSGWRKTRIFFLRTWLLPLILILVFMFSYSLNPTESNIVHRFLFLSYEIKNDSGTTQYGKGPWDIAFVCFYAIFLSFTREFIMHELLQPLALVLGVKSRGKQKRFIEQMYTAVYIAFIGPLGVYCMKHTSVWFFNTQGMYENYPHKIHDGLLKFYYLFQAAFWIQQALIMLLGVEQRRRDFRELVIHHIVTISLIGLSYRFHFTYMGIAVYITHDISDFFLAVSQMPQLCSLCIPKTRLYQISKSLNYIDSPLQGPAFGLCIAIWTYLRHYINLRILYSLYTDFSAVGPYELNWETEQYKCPISNVITFVLLAGLQTVNLYWLWCLLRNGYRFVFLGVAKDDRSEDEGPEVDTAEDRRANVVGEPVNSPLASGNGRLASGLKTSAAHQD